MAHNVQVKLTDIAHGGDAVGRIDGQVVFVPLALPGETVTVSVAPSSSSYLRASLVSVDAPSPDRVEPPCPAFGRCGGCQWQHIAYPEQLWLKQSILRAALSRIGHLTDPQVQPVQGMQNPWHYRNHVQLRVSTDGCAGYYALQSHDVVPVEKCLIAEPLLLSMWQAHRDTQVPSRTLTLRAGVHTGDRLAILSGRGASRRAAAGLPYSCLQVDAEGHHRVLAGRDHLFERVGRLTLRISADAFFQVNTRQAERLVEVAATHLELEPGESLLDAYCGGGLLGLSLAGPHNPLFGIESSGPSLKDAQANAGDRGVFWEGDVAEVLRRERPRVDAIVLDPPRTGCRPEAIEALSLCEARRIIYVSCDPATLARDVARFADHGYRFSCASPVDLFPQTYHLETVAVLERVA